MIDFDIRPSAHPVPAAEREEMLRSRPSASCSPTT